MKIAISLSVLIIISYFIFWFKDLDPECKIIELRSMSGKKLYIKKKNYGMTGDKQLTVISTVKMWDEQSETNDYLYKGLDPFIYSYANDTLMIYTQTKVKIPLNFHTSITIIQNELENPDYMRLMHKVIVGDTTSLIRI